MKRFLTSTFFYACGPFSFPQQATIKGQRMAHTVGGLSTDRTANESRSSE